MTPEEVTQLCRPLPKVGTLEVYETAHGFVRVMIQTHEPKWHVTGFPVWPGMSKTEVKKLYSEARKRHALGHDAAGTG